MRGSRAGYDAVVLAGGAGRRLGGTDKARLRVGGTRLLDRVLAACRDARRTVVVGPRRETARPVLWAREQPPGGGPLAGLAAGLGQVRARLVVVLAADLPFVTPSAVDALLGALPAEADGAVMIDPDGRDQTLLAAYRTAVLRRELAALVSGTAGPHGLPLRRLTARLRLARLPDPGGTATFDTDTWQALDAARARIREHGRVLDEWIAAVRTELGIDLDVDAAALLDLARGAAHGVARPAAPLTTFLVGYAAGRAGGGERAVAEAAARAAALARRWEEEEVGHTGPPTTPDAPAHGSGAPGGPGTSGSDGPHR